MESYSELAGYYDILMEDVDYAKWVDYIEAIFEQEGLKPTRILDTACGTGNITIPLSKRGYHMTGVDLSPDMLVIGEKKARQQKQSIRFINQDITKLNLNDKYDAVLCMCDGVNYIIDEKELMDFFLTIKNQLDEKGIFVFDISSMYKLQAILGNNILFEEKDNIYYIWENQFDEAEETIEMNLTFFAPEGGLFKKFHEYHIQKAYQPDYLRNLLMNAGFSTVRIYGFSSFVIPGEECERIAFVAIK